MEISIIKGNIEYLEDCESALLDSELGRRYFTRPGFARRSLEEGFSNEEIHVALDESNHCIGFIYVIPEGAFHAFPYLHIIAVKEEYRNQGIGKKLMKYFEDWSFQENNKVFLVVADFNPDAKRFYESIGYKEIGPIPDLYRPGITEHLMMKTKE